jgi:hypothetical protein
MTPYQSYCHAATQVWLVCNTKRMLCVAVCSLQVGSDVLDVQMRHVSLLPRTPGANMATSAGQATAGQLGGRGWRCRAPGQHRGGSSTYSIAWACGGSSRPHPSCGG